MRDRQDELFEQAGRDYAPAIARLARAMERDAEKARDLEQDIHCELWRSLARFDDACSLKTWVFRVAHNVAADHVRSAMRTPILSDDDLLDSIPDPADSEAALAHEHALARLHTVIRTLPLLDAQVILLWLEGHSGAEISEITGLTSNAAATRVHRIRGKLSAHFALPDSQGESA